MSALDKASVAAVFRGYEVLFILKLKSWHYMLCTLTNVNTRNSELLLYIAFSWFVVISSDANMRGNRSFSFSVNVVFNTSS
jgi:hypothetical protein